MTVKVFDATSQDLEDQHELEKLFSTVMQAAWMSGKNAGIVLSAMFMAAGGFALESAKDDYDVEKDMKDAVETALHVYRTGKKSRAFINDSDETLLLMISPEEFRTIMQCMAWSTKDEPLECKECLASAIELKRRLLPIITRLAATGMVKTPKHHLRTDH